LCSNETATVESDNLNTHFCNISNNNQTTKLIIPKRPSVSQNAAQSMLDEEQNTQICGPFCLLSLPIRNSSFWLLAFLIYNSFNEGCSLNS
jgi:hypothetical protein